MNGELGRREFGDRDARRTVRRGPERFHQARVSRSPSTRPSASPTRLIQNGGIARHGCAGRQRRGHKWRQIVEVTNGGAAAAAGLPSGVVVTKVDDRVISADALVAAVRSKAPGDKVTLTYLDPAGKPQTVEVTLSKAQQ